MYDSFYNVVENPFKISTDPRFLWCGEKHSKVLSGLIYGLMDHNGLVVLTGDIGTGKTTLVNALLNILGTDACVARINHPTLETADFLTLIAKSLDPNFTGTDKSDLLLFFDSFFLKARAEGKMVLIVIDEAQHLSMEVLEEIRLLSNMEQSGQRILSIMLVGQSELKPMLLSPQSRSLRQRITLFCEIEALSQEETQLYVEHRLKVSGLKEQLFTPNAMQMIHAFSRGNPRLINILCDRSMRIGYMKRHKKIDADTITECAGDINLCNPVTAKVLGLVGPEFQRWRNELPTQLRRQLATVGPSLQRVQTWLHLQGKAALPRSLSKCRALADNLDATSSRLLRAYRNKNHPSAWMAAISLIAIVLSISAYRIARDRVVPTSIATMPGMATQQSASTGPGSPLGANSEIATKNPTLLVSASPSPSQSLHRNPTRGTAVSDRRSTAEDKSPSQQPIIEEPVPTPLQIAASALAAKNYQKAIQVLEAHQTAGTDENRSAAGLYAKALIGRALELMATSPSKTQAMLLKAIDVAPDNARAYLILGKYQTHAKKYNQAIDAYRNAIRLDPHLSDALFNLGYIYATTGKLEEAETAFSKAAQLNPPYLGKSLFNLAVIQQKLGKTEQCLANLEKAVAMMPQNEKAAAYLQRIRNSASAGPVGQRR
jgi:type II secretory pathway predicted ATPase ExeA/tetratricopeptide (TPR) repeat protein